MLGPVARVRAIMLEPHTEWVAIESEAGPHPTPVVPYIAILAAIPALARFVGSSLVGGYAPLLSGLGHALAHYVLGFVLVYGLAMVANALAPSFDLQKDFSKALRLIVYSYTPVWLASIFLVVPGLSFLSIVGVYGVYVLWLGLPVMMHTPPRRRLPYAVTIGATAFVFELLLRTTLALI
jgi:hypothetical protein